MADIHHLRAHRVVHLPVRTLDDIASEHGAEAQHRPDPIEMLRQRLREDRAHRLQRAITWWCIVIATVAFWYFVAQLVRGWFA